MSEKNVEDVKVGDKILAFKEFPDNAQESSDMCVAEITKVFRRKAKVIELTFDDGSNLYITENHPILVRRNSWEGHKYDFRPAGELKPGRKPYAISKKVESVYDDAETSNENYMVGYIVGMTLGDGCLKDYRDRGQGVFFRLAVNDKEIIDRFKKYLSYFGVEYRVTNFKMGKGDAPVVEAVRSGKLSVFEFLTNLIKNNFRINKDGNYYKGFLASIYDAEGHIDKKGHTIRICNTDWNIIQEICDALTCIDMPYVIEEVKGTVNFDKKWNVRVKARNDGQNYKFIKLVSPATERKGLSNFINLPLSRKTLVSTRVAEELGEVEVYNFETTSHTYFANNIAVHNCYEINKSQKDMSWDVAKDIVDWMFEQYETEGSPLYGCQVPILEFIGGEPLIKLDLIEKILDYFWTKAINLNHIWAMTWKCNMTTNGVLWFEKNMDAFINKFGKNKMSITITVDGFKELHDSCRVYPDGRGTYDDVYAAVSHFHDKYLMQNHDTKLTISPENLPYLKKSIDYFISEGYNVIYANPIFEADWTASQAYDFYDAMKYISDKIIEENRPDIYIALLDKDKFDPVPENFNSNYCGGTGKMLAFDTEGNIYPCLRYMGISLGDEREPYMVGNVYDGMCHNDVEKHRWETLNAITRRSQSNDECYYCPIASGCANCNAYAYQIYGDPNTKNTKICVMHKARALANAYHWNNFYLKRGYGEPFKMNIPKEWALEIIPEDEWNMLKSLEEEAFDKSNQFKNDRK